MQSQQLAVAVAFALHDNQMTLAKLKTSNVFHVVVVGLLVVVTVIGQV